ncbi:MAG: helix-turn-helix transcriptional regulator [Halobacteriales archaeon]
MSPLEPRATVVVAILAVVLVSLVGAAVPPTAGQTGEGDLSVDPDDTLLWVEVDADGDAQWRMAYRIRLDTEADDEAFEELRADIEANASAYVDRHRERMASAAADAEAATGREMAVENVTVETDRRVVDREFGVVTYRFTWTNFARVEGDGVHVGDAIEGLFLTEDTDLVVRWDPEVLGFVEVAPEPTTSNDRSVRWDGPADFGTEEPRVALSSDPSADGGPSADGDRVPWVPVAVAVVLVGLGAAGYYLRRSSSQTADAVPDDDLLSNEEQVLRLVEERGGRLKQQEIAEALDWTDAKTSKVVRTLRDEGRLEGFRLGRENVLRLPGEDAP